MHGYCAANADPHCFVCVFISSGRGHGACCAGRGRSAGHWSGGAHVIEASTARQIQLLRRLGCWPWRVSPSTPCSVRTQRSLRLRPLGGVLDAVGGEDPWQSTEKLRDFGLCPFQVTNCAVSHTPAQPRSASEEAPHRSKAPVRTLSSVAAGAMSADGLPSPKGSPAVVVHTVDDGELAPAAFNNAAHFAQHKQAGLAADTAELPLDKSKVGFLSSAYSICATGRQPKRFSSSLPRRLLL